MEILLCGLDIAVSEHIPHQSKISSLSQKISCKGVASAVQHQRDGKISISASLFELLGHGNNMAGTGSRRRKHPALFPADLRRSRRSRTRELKGTNRREPIRLLPKGMKITLRLQRMFSHRIRNTSSGRMPASWMISRTS